jgi:hypothetical protein
MKVAGDDRGNAHQFQPGDHPQPDGATTDDQHGILAGRRAAPGMFQPHRQWLDHRAPVVIQSIGDFDQEILVQQHQFAAAAGAIMAETHHRLRPTRAHDRDRGDAPSGLHRAGAAGAIVQHFTDIFMPRHESARLIERGIRPAELARQIDDMLPGVQEMRV